MDQVVVNKNDGALEKAIEEVDPGEISKEQKDIPKEYKESFQTDSNDVTITFDAKVEEAEGALPVVQVKPHEITADEAKTWADVLFEGAKAYEPDTVMTKSEIEEEIVMYICRLKKPFNYKPIPMNLTVIVQMLKQLIAMKQIIKCIIYGFII